MSISKVRGVRLLAASLGLLAGACASDEATLGHGDEALTAAQCSYFQSGDKVTICHHTGAARKPYNVIRTNVASCGGHAGHAGDYITSSDPSSDAYDPTCSGQGCLPAGAPADATIECCDGLADVGGTCQPTTPRLVDMKLISPPGTWLASGGCGPGDLYKLFVSTGGDEPLNPGIHQGLDIPLVAGTYTFLFRTSSFFGDRTIQLILSDGTVLEAHGEFYGPSHPPPIIVGDRAYEFIALENTGNTFTDSIGCDGATSFADGVVDSIGNVSLTVTDL